MSSNQINIIFVILFVFLQLNGLQSRTEEIGDHVSEISLKFQSAQNITFTYQQAFRVSYQDSSYKANRVAPFCSLIQSHFIAQEAQRISLAPYCSESCLVEFRDRRVFIVNEIGQFLVFKLVEEGNNSEFRMPYFSLTLLMKDQITDEFTSEILAESRLALNENTSSRSAALFMHKQVFIYDDTTNYMNKCEFDFTHLESQSFKLALMYNTFLIIPDDSTGIQIYNCKKGSIVSAVSFTTIKISSFFVKEEWETIQESLKNNSASNNNNSNNSSSEEFLFDFSIQSLMISADGTMLYAYERYSKAICVFQIELNLQSQVSSVSMVSKVSLTGRVDNVASKNNYLYAHKISSKGIREVNQLVEMQLSSKQAGYLPRQTYPLSSPIEKIEVSNLLIYLLQENIIGVIRRQVPLNMVNEEEQKQQISIQYSEGAEDLWVFPVSFNSQLNISDKKSSQSIIQSAIKEPSKYFSTNITLSDNESTTVNVDAILIRQNDVFSIKVVQERLPYLSCQSEDEKQIYEKYQSNVNVEVFEAVDEEGNIKLKTYSEVIEISVYREIFENSTIALVVGLSFGLVVSFIVVIVFCIYFYKMKNHYQLLLQDSNAKGDVQLSSNEFDVESHNNTSSSDNSSSESSRSQPDQVIGQVTFSPNKGPSGISNNNIYAGKENRDSHENQPIRDDGNLAARLAVFPEENIRQQHSEEKAPSSKRMAAMLTNLLGQEDIAFNLLKNNNNNNNNNNTRVQSDNLYEHNEVRSGIPISFDEIVKVLPEESNEKKGGEEEVTSNQKDEGINFIEEEIEEISRSQNIQQNNESLMMKESSSDQNSNGTETKLSSIHLIRSSMDGSQISHDIRSNQSEFTKSLQQQQQQQQQQLS